jgi:Protein of unknown function (DUF2795)
MIASTTEGQLRRCLAEVRFPASKQDLIDAAVSDRCDDDTVAALRAISTMTYTNVTQIIASASIVDLGGGDSDALRSLSTASGDAEGTEDKSAPSEGGEV